MQHFSSNNECILLLAFGCREYKDYWNKYFANKSFQFIFYAFMLRKKMRVKL